MSQKRALEGIRVIDFTWVRAGPWATRLLSNLGAEVIKVEWPTTGLHYLYDRIEVRSYGRETRGLNEGAYFSELTVGKQSITVNLRRPQGLDVIKRLLRTSDLVVENLSAGILDGWGLGYDAMRACKDDIVYVSMAGLGQVGRHSDYKTFGWPVQALSGLTHLSGLPEHEPAGWGWAYMDDVGAEYAVICALAALHFRNRTGKGQHVDLSQVAAGMGLMGPAWLDYTANGRSLRRAGFPPGNRTHWPGSPLLNNYRGQTTAPHNAYRTAAPAGEEYNAWCVIACYSDDEWQRLVALMGAPAWATAEEFRTGALRIAHQIELDRGIETWTHTLDKYELTERCQRAGIHAMPVQDARERVDVDPQLRQRGMLQELPHAVLGPFRYQRLPFQSSAMDLALTAAGPLAGEHNERILCGVLGVSQDELQQGYADGTFWPRDLPLEPYLAAPGTVHQPSHSAPPNKPRVEPPDAQQQSVFGDLRVLEVGDERGEWVAKLLGDLGADVVKVEPPGGSVGRSIGPFLEDRPGADRSLSFWHRNTSKRGISLSLETEDGRDLFRRLVQHADVLVDSYAPGYLSGLGLGYDQLAALNPRLIMCSVTPFGQTGPWRDYVASDLTQLAAGGIMAACGYDADEIPNAPPIAPTGGQSLTMGGHFACIAIGAAVCYRDATGLGQWLDVSIHEACSITTAGHVPDYLARGDRLVRATGRTGRPAGIQPSSRTQFRCADGNYVIAWWSAARATPEQIESLAYWLDDFDIAHDLHAERYQDPEFMRAHNDHIVEILQYFISQVDAEEVYHGGQARGFPFGPVRAVEDILADEHLQDRASFVELDHPELGRSITYPGAYALFGASPWRLSRRAPTLGEHNQEIYTELGLDPARLVVLAEARVI